MSATASISCSDGHRTARRLSSWHLLHSASETGSGNLEFQFWPSGLQRRELSSRTNSSSSYASLLMRHAGKRVEISIFLPSSCLASNHLPFLLLLVKPIPSQMILEEALTPVPSRPLLRGMRLIILSTDSSRERIKTRSWHDHSSSGETGTKTSFSQPDWCWICCDTLRALRELPESKSPSRIIQSTQFRLIFNEL